MFEDLKSLSGEKWFWPVIIGGCVLFVGALALSGSKQESGEVLVNPTGYTSYPDAVTNANTIIDSVNQFSEYTGDRIIASTSGYMEEGIKNIMSGMQTEFDEIDSTIAGLGGTLDSVAGDVGTIKTDLGTIKTDVSAIKSKPSGTTVIYRDSGSSSSSSKKTQTETVVRVDKPTGSNTGVQSSPTVSSPVLPTPTGAKSTTSYYSTSYKGNSLVDGLKSAGVYSIGGKKVDSWQSRVELAKANGISNYTGTAAQNTQLLKSLKAGTLKKV